MIRSKIYRVQLFQFVLIREVFRNPIETTNKAWKTIFITIRLFSRQWEISNTRPVRIYNKTNEAFDILQDMHYKWMRSQLFNDEEINQDLKQIESDFKHANKRYSTTILR